MSDTKHTSRRVRGTLSLFTRLFLIACFLIGGFVLIGYAVGWITFQYDKQEQEATIKIETGEVQQTAAEALDQSKALVEEAGDAVQELNETETDNGRPADTNETAPGRKDVESSNRANTPQQ